MDMNLDCLEQSKFFEKALDVERFVDRRADAVEFGLAT